MSDKTLSALTAAATFAATDLLYGAVGGNSRKVTGTVLGAFLAASGLVLGAPSGAPTPGTVTDNAIVRWDGTTGTLVQNSSAQIDDSGTLSIIGDFGGFLGSISGANRRSVISGGTFYGSKLALAATGVEPGANADVFLVRDAQGNPTVPATIPNPEPVLSAIDGFWAGIRNNVKSYEDSLAKAAITPPGDLT